jgi:hypothetical protein
LKIPPHRSNQATAQVLDWCNNLRFTDSDIRL